MKKLLAILLTVIVILVFSGTLYFLYSKSKEEPVEYGTETPYITSIIQKTVATGSVVPRNEVNVKPRVSGIIDTLYVEPGDSVKEGDLIARIRIIPDMVTLNNAQNRANRARISMNDARRELERQKSLRLKGAVSMSEFQDAETAFQSAQEELSSALNNLELIQKGSTTKTKESANTLVKATIAGMVLEVPVEQGDSVIETNTFNDGTTIATVADMNELVFEGKVDESEVGKLEEGMELLLTIGAIEGRRFQAKLEHIAPKGVPENGAIQFQIRAALEQQDGAFIRANYSANADIVLDRRDEVLAIKEALLQFEDGKPFVEIENGPQSFERREIETGLSDGISIEVVSGLTAETKVKKPEPKRG